MNSSARQLIVLLCSAGWALQAVQLAAQTNRAASTPPLFDKGDQKALEEALSCLNYSVADLDFSRNQETPELTIPAVREALEHALTLPVLAQESCAAARSPGVREVLHRSREWVGAAAMSSAAMEAPTASGQDAAADIPAMPDAFNRQIYDFLGKAALAGHLAERAMERVSPAVRRHAWATHLAGLFKAEDRPEVRRAMMEIGISSTLIQQVIAELNALDPEPAARTYVATIASVDVAMLIAAEDKLYQAAVELAESLSGFSTWPDQIVEATSYWGRIIIGTPGNDCYSRPAALIIDPGGDDLYLNAASAVNLTAGAAVRVVIDLAGDDRYEGHSLAGTASAVFGISLLLDVAGCDYYRDHYSGAASAFCGAGLLVDRAGDDSYRCWGFGQGAAECGLALLRDAAGDDRYHAGICAQAFAGTRGISWLIDDSGQDTYFVGGREPDYERHDDRFLSLGQGCSLGNRPFSGGGIAVLADMHGNDTYTADVYGQGVGYWYGVGMLLDGSGNDIYTVYHYGQGAGIHLACGLLYDGSGNDIYTGYILSQAAAHDFAVGMLLDRQGNDSYSADHHSQGRAINNALAVLIDGGGDDAYFARQPQRCQGSGNMGGDREYGSMALLLDRGGDDSYSSGAINNATLLRPMFGVVYDAGPLEECVDGP